MHVHRIQYLFAGYIFEYPPIIRQSTQMQTLHLEIANGYRMSHIVCLSLCDVGVAVGTCREVLLCSFSEMNLSSPTPSERAPCAIEITVRVRALLKIYIRLKKAVFQTPTASLAEYILFIDKITSIAAVWDYICGPWHLGRRSRQRLCNSVHYVMGSPGTAHYLQKY